MKNAPEAVASVSVLFACGADNCYWRAVLEFSWSGGNSGNEGEENHLKPTENVDTNPVINSILNNQNFPSK